MGRIADRFSALRERGEKALIPFVTAGDPDLATTEAFVRALAAAGADAVEIGVPFSDPTAEGPTIQRASERALAGGVSLRDVLRLVKKLREDVDIPLILMGYANNFIAMGEAEFVKVAADVGVDGTIIVDLPPEEGEAFFAAEAEAGIDAILLAAPTTSSERLAMLAERTRGFLYYVSLTGVTGARATMAGDIREGVERARASGDVPVCVGFGISTPEHAAEVGAYADGVVVGSAFVTRIEQAHSADEAIDAVAAFAAELKAPLRPSS
jgi:tryptophan synthase alpha chain